MSNINTIAIVKSFGDNNENSSDTVLDLIRHTMKAWVEKVAGRSLTVESVFSDEEIGTFIELLGSGLIIRKLKTVQGFHYVFSAASINEADLYLLY